MRNRRAANCAVSGDDGVKVQPSVVLGHKVDQSINRIPVADKAGEAEDHAG
jgi:hypothetical protein